MPRTRPSFPVKKKIAEAAAKSDSNPAEVEQVKSELVPDSLDASLEAQAAELAASLPGDNSEPDAEPVKSELARTRASQAEIEKLVGKLPDRVREQMDQLFRARYTRIQKLDLDTSEADSKGNH